MFYRVRLQSGGNGPDRHTVVFDVSPDRRVRLVHVFFQPVRQPLADASLHQRSRLSAVRTELTCFHKGMNLTLFLFENLTGGILKNFKEMSKFSGKKIDGF